MKTIARATACGLLGVSALIAPPVCVAQDPNACDVAGEYPDLIVGKLDSIGRFGAVDGITAYAIAATSCNLGTCWVNWFFGTEDHPVFAQNIFRLQDGRFEQIGQSWVAHRFFALSSTFCEPGCLPTNGQHLGVNCSSSNAATTTGTQAYLGPKSEVNASSGTIEFPFTDQGVSGNLIYKRLQVHNDDLDPLLNPTALYFIEGQNVAADDGAARMQNNNASYREVLVAGPDFQLALTGTGEQQQPAIHAWAAADPDVVLEAVDLPDDGRILIASLASSLGGGNWHYEYAIQNLSSHRSAGTLSVPIPSGAVVTNLGFHDVDYHSGEPLDGTDWSATIETGTTGHAVVWSTDSFDTNPAANALRWGTLYNFRFDADVPPADGALVLGLFRPGSPDTVSVTGVVPRLCDADGGCEPGENPCNCGGDCGQPPETELSCADAADNDCDSQTDCQDSDCCGGPVCPASDGDGDGLLACADCDDGNAEIWATPGEVTQLVLDRDDQNRALLGWSAPASPGATAVVYETLRTPNPADFLDGAQCLQVFDASATTAVDAEIPSAGSLFGYLVRASNGCPLGSGPLGHASDGSERPAAVCP
jgi:hypothetical protein